jgi:hypothetical protein
MTRLVPAVIAAITVPFASWHFAASEDRLTTGLTSTPFGWPRLLFGHLAAAVPLGYILARKIGAWSSTGVRFAFAAAVTAILGLALPAVGETLDEADAGMAIRSVARTMIAVFASTAWLAVAGREPRLVGRLPWLAAVAFAVVPPLAYAHRLAETHAADFETFAKSGRLVRARGALEGLRDLGSTRTFSGKTAGEWIPRLRKDLDRMAKLAAVPLGHGAALPERIRRAMLLIQLNRPESAEVLLREIESPTAEVWLMRAAIARESGRWSDLEVACREAIARQTSTDSTELLEVAFDGLGEALRQSRRPDDAAANYREAAKRLPNRAAYYRFQLGLIAAERGQMRAALDDFSEALRLDPNLKSLVDPQIQKVHTNFAGCLDRRN